MNEMKRIFDQAVKASEERQWIPGRLGRINSDGSVSLKVQGRPNFVHVRIGADGELGPTIARNLGVPLRAHLPIRMRREQGLLVVHGVDHTGGRLDAFLGDTATAPIGYHTHRTGSGLEYETQAILLEPGRVKPGVGLTVVINPFRYFTGSVWQTYEGGTLDLTSYVPATTGHWGWVVVGVDPSTNVATAAAGSTVVYATGLVFADIDSINIGAMIPCGAIKVRNDDTHLKTASRYYDAHGWFNQFVDHEHALAELTDTNIDTPSNAQFLRYNIVNGKWENQTQLIPTGLNDLNGVSISGLADGQLLIWVYTGPGASDGHWANLTAPYLLADGSTVLTGNWDVGEDIRLLAEAIRARDTEGLLLERSGGGVGIALNNDGDVGIGTATPVGKFHTAGGFSNASHWEYTPVGNTAVDIIPDGAGDVVYGVTFMYIIVSIVAAAFDGIAQGQTTLTPGNSAQFVVGSGTYDFAVSAGGAFTIQRTAGAGTANVSVWALWQ